MSQKTSEKEYGIFTLFDDQRSAFEGVKSGAMA
jgi:hypothetical protein